MAPAMTDNLPEVQIRFREPDWTSLTGHLFPGDGDEHGAALLCGWATIGNKTFLLVREVIHAIDGVDYVAGNRGYRHLTGEFVTKALRRAKDHGLVYLAVHNHGGRDRVEFSGTDLASHDRGYPTLLRLNDNPVGGLVLAEHAVAGDIWFTDGTRTHVNATVVVGRFMEVVTEGRTVTHDDGSLASAAVHARQALIFGEAGNDRMRRMKVAIVGAGGIGMLIIQALSRLGVGHLVVIDPDYVSKSNLSRLPEATMRDAVGWFGTGWIGTILNLLGINKPTWKVKLARRIVRRANPKAKVTAIRGDVADDAVARELLTCDFIFLAADTMLAREVVNQISYQYLIPTLQVGSKVVVDRDTGTVRDVYGVVRSLGATAGCMRCNGLINLTKLAEEVLASDEQRRNQRYVDEPGIEAPSVITLNSMSAGWAVNDFMQYASGLGRPATGFRLLRSRPVAPGHPQLVVQRPDIDPTCHVCSLAPYSVLAVGDTKELPTRIQHA